MNIITNFSAPIFQQRSNQQQNRNNTQQTSYLSKPMYDTVSFSGLTKKMGKHTYIDGQKDIKEFVDKRGDKSLIVGELPKFMIDKLPKTNRRESIMEIYDTFSQVATELRDFDESKATTISEITNRRKQETVDKLQNVLEKHKIISKWDDFDIEYLGKGGKGAGYKLSGLRDNTRNNEDEFIIKVFHIVEGKDWQQYKSHGCYAEMNSAQYWMKNVGKNTNRGKFFWGDLRSGYMINKYVDDDVRLPEKVVDPYKYGLKCTDEDAQKKHNVCKGYSYDWGGVRVVNRLKNGDNYARKVMETIKNTPENSRDLKWAEIYASKKGNAESRQAGLAMGIKYMKDKQKYFDICKSLHKPEVDQGLAYSLKYFPYEDAVQNFERLIKTNDTVTQVVLFNEIPLLAMKHRDGNIKDDLQTVSSEIIPSRIKTYYDISEKYAHPDSIEHLASFVHLLPKEDFRDYYTRLANIKNEALQDRMIYKLSNVDLDNRLFACKSIAKGLENDRLKEKLLSSSRVLPDNQLQEVKEILDNNDKKASD